MDHEFTIAEKKKQLASVKDEVKEFHPILENILCKLPRVVDVKNTHGKDEWGADFVLTRKDDLTGVDEHIGVIVKVGKIHQDLTAIEKQIDECDEERTGSDSKRNIRLDEIWIVSNDNITGGAEKAIYRKFSTKKIKFFHGKDIVKFIDQYNSSYWYEVPVKIGDHLRRVSRLLDEIENLSSLVSSGSSIYIDQEVVEGEWASEKNYKLKRKNNRKRLINIYEEIDNNKVIFIEADAGYGKSKLIRRIASNFCKPKIYIEKGYVPFFVNYRDLCDDYGASLDNFTEDMLSKENLLNYENKGFIYFIDGVDEKKADNDTQLMVINSFIDQVVARDKCRVVFATRPIGLLEGRDGFDCDVKKLEVKPLAISAVVSFFQKFLEHVGISSKILEDLRSSQIFSQLPKSPIAAILLAKLIQENHQDLPSNLTELYNKYLELILGRWDIKKGINTEKEYEATKSIVCKISKYFIDNNLNKICEEEAFSFFEEFLRERNLGINPRELFNNTISRSNVLSLSNADHCVSFKHRTFCEFFYAMQALNRNSNFKIDEKCFNYYWKNVYFFYIGILKDCEDTLEEILNVVPEDTASKFYKILYMGDYYLAGYQSPYRVVEKFLPEVFTEAGKLYNEILNNKVDTPFSEMPPIEVLWLFQMIIRKEYGYNFFKKALTHTTLTISENKKLSTKNKIFSLFFLATTSLELGEKEPFDFLIKEYGGEIDSLIAEGMRNEIERLSSPSVDEKKYLKKVSKKLHSTSQARQLIYSFYNMPIGEMIEGTKKN